MSATSFLGLIAEARHPGTPGRLDRSTFTVRPRWRISFSADAGRDAITRLQPHPAPGLPPTVDLVHDWARIGVDA